MCYFQKYYIYIIVFIYLFIEFYFLFFWMTDVLFFYFLLCSIFFPFNLSIYNHDILIFLLSITFIYFLYYIFLALVLRALYLILKNKKCNKFYLTILFITPFFHLTLYKWIMARGV